MVNTEGVYHSKLNDLPPDHWGLTIKMEGFNANVPDPETEHKHYEYGQRSTGYRWDYNDTEGSYLQQATNETKDVELRQLMKMCAKNLRLTWNSAEKKKGKAHDGPIGCSPESLMIRREHNYATQARSSENTPKIGPDMINHNNMRRYKQQRGTCTSPPEEYAYYSNDSSPTYYYTKNTLVEGANYMGQHKNPP